MLKILKWLIKFIVLSFLCIVLWNTALSYSDMDILAEEEFANEKIVAFNDIEAVISLNNKFEYYAKVKGDLYNVTAGDLNFKLIFYFKDNDQIKTQLISLKAKTHFNFKDNINLENEGVFDKVTIELENAEKTVAVFYPSYLKAIIFYILLFINAALLTLFLLSPSLRKYKKSYQKVDNNIETDYEDENDDDLDNKINFADKSHKLNKTGFKYIKTYKTRH